MFRRHSQKLQVLLRLQLLKMLGFKVLGLEKLNMLLRMLGLKVLGLEKFYMLLHKRSAFPSPSMGQLMPWVSRCKEQLSVSSTLVNRINRISRLSRRQQLQQGDKDSRSLRRHLVKCNPRGFVRRHQAPVQDPERIRHERRSCLHPCSPR